MQRLARTLCLCLVFLSFGCKDITHVQTGYVGDRDECRGRSENDVGLYSQPDSYPLNDKDKNAALLQLFCECMKQKDWKVAGCPKPAAPTQVAQTPQQPTVVVVQSPTSQPALLPEAAPEAVAAPVAARGKRKKAVCTPPNTCPAPTEYYNTGTPNQTPVQSDQQLQGILQRQ